MAAFLFAGAVLADEPAPRVSFSLRGSSQPGKVTGSLTLTVNEGHPRAVSIYSLPSKTLLGAYVDNTRGQASVRDYMTARFPNGAPARLPLIELPLRSGARALLSSGVPEPTDSVVHVIVRGVYPDDRGTLTEREFDFRVTTNPGEFAFTWNGLNRLQDDGTFRIQNSICCGQGFCGDCAECGEGQEFSCCLVPGWDDFCGWCGKLNASCKAELCSGC